MPVIKTSTKGRAVAVWLADNGVAIKRFLGETEDGLLYLGNDNPIHPVRGFWA